MTINAKKILLVEDNDADSLLLQGILARDVRMPMELSWTECL